MTKEKQYSP